MTARSDRSGHDTIAALKAAARLYADDQWQELGMRAEKEIRETVSRVLIPFKLAGYRSSDALAALSVALVRTLANVHRDLVITPDDLGRITADELIKARKRKETK
jgi:hypothetical protein